MVNKLSYLTKEEIDRLKSEIELRRDRLILEVLYETGCTVNELINIHLQDIDFENNIISFHTNSQERKSFVSPRLIEDIKTYSKRHTSPYLLSSRQSQQITTKRVRQIIRLYGNLAGFQNIHPQTIRYSHIAQAVNKGIPLASIQRQIGMKDLRMVQLYNSVTSRKKEDEYKKFL